MKRKYLIILIVFCILVIPYFTITSIAVGTHDLFNPVSIIYFPGVVMQLIANEGNGVICSDACGPCSAWGPFYVLVDGECVFPGKYNYEVEVLSQTIISEEIVDGIKVTKLKQKVSQSDFPTLEEFKEMNAEYFAFLEDELGDEGRKQINQMIADFEKNMPTETEVSEIEVIKLELVPDIEEVSKTNP